MYTKMCKYISIYKENDMKKFLIGIAATLVASNLFAQSADYTKFLNQAKKYETEKNGATHWMHIMMQWKLMMHQN